MVQGLATEGLFPALAQVLQAVADHTQATQSAAPADASRPMPAAHALVTGLTARLLQLAVKQGKQWAPAQQLPQLLCMPLLLDR